MKLYRISQNLNNGYDTYDSAIVAAKNAEEAALIHPSGNANDWKERTYGSGWCRSPRDVEVELIGTAIKGTKAGVVLASFNAG